MFSLVTHPLASGHPPTWARGWGQDRHGVFTEIRAGTVVQRMRWIPPSIFRMGSPESEAGRQEWDSPRHDIELTEGFWLADTPCTQELWQEVMGENPSRFRSPRRPVEQVTWEDCQDFLEKWNNIQPGLELQLPTEAQWEHACRAGNGAATWMGDLEILGERHAPVLDEIAWYAGNSGVDFDLGEGEDSSGWRQKQYPHELAGTHEVKLKSLNPWGLYDMLGNVWEWCSDLWIDQYAGDLETNPIGPGSGARRVVRGGSWYARVRDLRAASRNGVYTSDRFGSLGFRVSRGQEPGW